MRKSGWLLFIAILVATLSAACDVVPTPEPLPLALSPAKEPLQKSLETMIGLESYHVDAEMWLGPAPTAPSSPPTGTCTMDFVGEDQNYTSISIYNQTAELMLGAPSYYYKKDGHWVKYSLGDIDILLMSACGVVKTFPGAPFIQELQRAFGGTVVVGPSEILGNVQVSHLILTSGGTGAQTVTAFWIDPVTHHILKVQIDKDLSSMNQLIDDTFKLRLKPIYPLTPLPTPPPGTISQSRVVYTFSRFNDPTITIPKP